MSIAADFVVRLGAIEFLRPGWLFALLPLAVLLGRLMRPMAYESGGWHGVVDAHRLPHLTASRPPRGRRRAVGLLAAGLTAAVLALAGPALPGKSELAYRSDAARVLVVDLSPAMADSGGTSSRIERAQVKLLDLLQAAPAGQTALIVYAAEPYLVAPPTTDTATIALLVPELAPDAVPVAGNHPEFALQMAAEVLGRSGAKARDVLWITAGTVPSDAVVTAAVTLQAQGIRLSILHAPEPAPAADATAEMATLTAFRGMVRSSGLYVALRVDDADVRELARWLNAAAGPVADARRAAVVPRELGIWLLPLILLLAALAFRRGVLLTLALPLLCVPPPADATGFDALWLRPDQRAMRLLRSGDAEQAAALFSDPRWQAIAQYRAGHTAEAATTLASLTDADSLYNRGNALARANRLDDALAAFDAALQLRPDDADILHNRDLVRELLQRRPDAEQTPEDGDGAGAPPNAPDSLARSDSANRGEGRSDPTREAGLLAEQWLRGVPDEPAGLLRRKLRLEQQRRESGEAPRPWR
jgi:Ca-activated chloride channel family protein